MAMFALMSSACLITVIIAAFACSGVFSLIGITATSFHMSAYVFTSDKTISNGRRGNANAGTAFSPHHITCQ